MKRVMVGAFLISCSILACASSHPGGGGEPPGQAYRIPLLNPHHPLYNRLEAPHANNACASDAHCMRSGCSHEVCAAESLITTCELPAHGWPIQGASCGCVSGECIWFR